MTAAEESVCVRACVCKRVIESERKCFNVLNVFYFSFKVRMGKPMCSVNELVHYMHCIDLHYSNTVYLGLDARACVCLFLCACV